MTTTMKSTFAVGLLAIGMFASLVGTCAGFAAVQGIWGACLVNVGNVSQRACMCDPNNFPLNVPFAMLADGPGLFQLWTGKENVCSPNLGFFHGSPGNDFLSMVSWMYLYGSANSMPDLMHGAMWMAADPVTDGISLWPEGNGGIEGLGFQFANLYKEILPMAVGLDSWLYWNNTCKFDEAVGRVLPDNAFYAIHGSYQWAVQNGASFSKDLTVSDFISCLKGWETDGLTTWMSAFVAPLSSDAGQQNFASAVRFGDGTWATARKLYNLTIGCSSKAWNLWLKLISAPLGNSETPLQRVSSTSTAVENLIRGMMKAGSCGPPAYR
jgi:hypothetical protein